MATPEFWEILIDESFPAPADERADVNSVSVLSPTTQLACEDPEEPRILEQNCPRLDDKATKDRAPKVMEDHSVALYGRISQAGTDQHKYEDNNYPVCSVLDTCPMTDQSQTQETPHSTTKCAGESGKSTIMKQMGIVYSSALSEDEPKTRINESNFELGSTKVQILDVDIQEPSRKKWLNCFEDVGYMIFVAALSSYDQHTAEGHNAVHL
ncbi:hypothetical protein NUH16_003815 [Penicillium rubens]|nr:hypothetical protein NUH16_003815 [Penicillium rubens]